MGKTKIKSSNRVGSRKVKKKVNKCWTEEDIQECLHYLESTPGVSLRSAATKYKVSESTVRWRIGLSKSKTTLKTPGRKCVLSAESEKNLANCIGNYNFFYYDYCCPWSIWGLNI